MFVMLVSEYSHGGPLLGEGKWLGLKRGLGRSERRTLFHPIFADGCLVTRTDIRRRWVRVGGHGKLGEGGEPPEGAREESYSRSSRSVVGPPFLKNSFQTFCPILTRETSVKAKRFVGGSQKNRNSTLIVLGSLPAQRGGGGGGEEKAWGLSSAPTGRFKRRKRQSLRLEEGRCGRLWVWGGGSMVFQLSGSGERVIIPLRAIDD